MNDNNNVITLYKLQCNYLGQKQGVTGVLVRNTW